MKRLLLLIPLFCLLSCSSPSKPPAAKAVIDYYSSKYPTWKCHVTQVDEDSTVRYYFTNASGVRTSGYESLKVTEQAGKWFAVYNGFTFPL